jgi:hypothetical protein
MIVDSEGKDWDALTRPAPIEVELQELICTKWIKVMFGERLKK